MQAETASRFGLTQANWTSFSSTCAQAWDGHEVVDLAVGSPAPHYAEENPDEVVAAVDDKTEAVTNAESNQLEVCFYGRSMSDMGRMRASVIGRADIVKRQR